MRGWGSTCCIIREAQERIFRRTSSIELRNRDFEALARAYGAAYFCIPCHREIEPKLKEALGCRGLVFVDARVEYGEMTRYFKGASTAVISRMPRRQKVRMAARIVGRLF